MKKSFDRNILHSIDFGKIDSLLEGFTKITGFCSKILDLDGNILSKSEYISSCTDFHRINSETEKISSIGDTDLLKEIENGEKYHLYKYSNGLMTVSVPLFIKGEYVANLFSGEFFLEEPEIDSFREHARLNGFNEEEYINVLCKIPILSEEKVVIAMDSLLNMIRIISDFTVQSLEPFDATKSASEKNYKMLFESNPHPMWVYDLETLRFLEVNKAAIQKYGFSRSEFLQLTLKDIRPEEDLQKLIENVQQESKSYSFSGEWRHKNKAGDIFFVEIISHEIKYKNRNARLVVANDISIRRIAEMKLKESEERYRNIIEASPVGILILQNEEIVFVNPGGMKIFGAQIPEQIIGKKASNILHTDYVEISAKRMRRLLNGEKGLYPVENKYIKLDGTVIELEVIATLLTYQNEPAIQVIFIDITERKRLIMELEHLNSNLELMVEQRTAHLEEANRELEAFSYSVSHDLRAPLRHINGYVDLLNSRYKEKLDEKALHYLRTISVASKQMGTLIDDLLHYSRTGRAEFRAIELDLNVLLAEVFRELEPILKGRNIKWEIEILPKVFADYSLIKLVFINLLDNAVKYTRNLQLAIISIGYKINERDFVFCVSDNGVGFDMKYAKKLFGVFQRFHTQAEFEGTGIGLANVQRIIHKHSGKVWAEAESGVGASFYFSLPILK